MFGINVKKGDILRKQFRKPKQTDRRSRSLSRQTPAPERSLRIKFQNFTHDKFI